MLKKVLHKVGANARFFMPASLVTVLYMLYRIRGAYFEGGLFTVHNSDFRKDPVFQKAYRAGKATGSRG
jgi:hypothetical protein